MFKEFGFATKNGFSRNILKPEEYRDEFIKLHPEDACYETYMSYDVDDQDSAALKAPLVFDLDSEEAVELALIETRKIVKILFQIGIKPNVYFSGAKGFHVVIPFECFGIEPQFYLISIFKIMAKGLADTNKLKTVDLVIYERKRLFRINNTKNIKTGLYKIFLSYEELGKSLEEIKQLAVNPRPENLQKPEVNKQLNASYKLAERNFLKTLERKNEHRICTFDEVKMRPCIKKILAEGAMDGERNSTCYTLALFFKSQNMLEDEVKEALKGFSGLNDKEIDGTVRSAYKSTYKWGCNDNDLVQKYCDKAHCSVGYQKLSITDMIWNKDELIEEIEKEERGEMNTNLTFGAQELDDAWEGIRKDELIIVAADSGIGKTTFAYWLTKQNTAIKNRVLFCSLEMSTSALISRACKETNTSFADMKKWITESPVFFYKDGKRLSTKNLRRNLEESVKNNFGVDLIIIDHLGYVEMPSDKMYDSFTSIATDLSNFAKELSIPIILLTHFNKGQSGASNKPRSVNDILGSGRLRDLASKVIQIWYPQEGNEFGGTMFLLHKNRYGSCPSVNLKYENGGYKYDPTI